MKPTPSQASLRSQGVVSPSRDSLNADPVAPPQLKPTYARPPPEVGHPPSPSISDLSVRNSFARAGAMITTPSKSHTNSLTVLRSLGPLNYTQVKLGGPKEDRKDHIDYNPAKFIGNLANIRYRQTSDWQRSSMPNIGFKGVDRIKYDYNPLYTSPEFRKTRMKAGIPPQELVKAVCAIYTIGYGFDSGSHSYGRPNGLGFLLSDSLLMTAHEVIPNEEVAIESYAQFRDGEVFNFDPYRSFATSKKYEFTIVAFKEHHSHTSLRFFVPLQIVGNFSLSTNSPANYLPHNPSANKHVVIVDKDRFTVESSKHETILPGTPIFDNDWQAQGLYVKTVNKLHVCMRFEPMIIHLSANLVIQHNEILNRFLNGGDEGFIDKFHSRYIYYFEWQGKKAWRYDIDREAWEEVVIRNFENVDITHADWSFHWGSRLVYLKNGTIMIIGGKDKMVARETGEVWAFMPQKYNTMSKLAPMGMPRDSCAAVVLDDNYVYVFGGKPYTNTCERYSIKSNLWQPVASMFYGRYDASACTALDTKFIFVFGGQPLNLSGATVERYNTEMNHWELLSITLPRPLYRLTVFPISNRRIAVLGGSGSNSVFVMYAERSIVFSSLAVGSESQDFYILKDGQRNLEEPVESVYPAAFDRSRNCLYILNMSRQSTSSKVPSVVQYNVEYFDFTERVDATSKPLEMSRKMSISQRSIGETYTIP
mmetsp:Transcript_19104/g.34756  ORF Transcript_19104/g.34756 Transcript_19104/m.34756 type:complete len:705 (-) Transcript_19104:35-2149(-)